MTEFPRCSRLALAVVMAGSVLSSCQPPQKRNADPSDPAEPPEVTEQSTPPEPIVVTPPPIPPPPRPEPVAPPTKAPPKPIVRPTLAPAPKPVFRPAPKVTARSVAILKDNTEWPSLLVEETEPSEPGKSASLKITGTMRSESAFRSSIERLHKALPGHKIVVEVSYGPHIRATDWSDRVDTLWGTFFHQVGEGTWQHESGLTTLRGEADSAFAIESLTHFHDNLMKGADPHRVDSFLTAP